MQYDHDSYTNSQTNSTFANFVDIYNLPENALTINGLEYNYDKVWMADTSSPSFFSFDPVTTQFTKYVTSDPPQSAYGNATGIIKSPVSGPYWIKSMDNRKIVFNQQTANRIAVLDTPSESLVEYVVPSKNPFWADCDTMNDCGVAQVFDFTIHDEKIWFTEWAENNIGVVDTTIMLPSAIELDSDSISLGAGESKNLSLIISALQNLDASLILSSTSDSLDVSFDSPKTFELESGSIDVSISASDESVPGVYKALGVQTEDVSVSKFLTVIIE